MDSSLISSISLGLLLVGSAGSASDSFYLTLRQGNMSFERGLAVSDLDTIRGDQGSWAAGVGYDLNRHVAIQAEYLDLGVVNHTRLCGPPEKLCLSQPPVTLRTAGLSVSVVPRVSLNRRISAFGKLGLVRLTTKAWSLNRVESERDNDELYYGGGLRFELWPRLSLLTEYEAAGTEVSNVSFGASFEF